MLTNLFETLGSIVTAFSGLLKSIFESAIGLIYNSTSGSEGFTDFGTILLIGIGTGLLIWGLQFLMRYIKVKA